MTMYTLKTRSSIIVWGIGVILAGVAGFSLHQIVPSSTKKDDPCSQHVNQRQWILCYNQKVHEVSKTQGTAAALQFAKRAIIENRPYAVNHFAMHVIGQDAYHNTRDIQKGLAYLPTGALELENFLHYDGYKHGLFQAFFYENKSINDIQILWQKACPELDRSDPRLGSISFKEGTVENCFHGVGHALMYADGNDVFKSVARCDELSGANMRYWCYIGVFMENSYLHSDFLYDWHAPRPFVKKDAMVSLCQSFSGEEKAPLCSQYVGRAYWIMYYPDVKGALGQCRLVTPEYIVRCLRQVIIYPLAGFFRDDYKKIIDMCDDLGPIYKKTCINAAASGMVRGVGGPNAKKKEFCSMVDKVFRRGCLAAR